MYNFIRLIEAEREGLKSLNVAIPESLKEKFDLAVKIDGRPKRRIMAEIIEKFCSEMLPENYESMKKLIDRNV